MKNKVRWLLPVCGVLSLAALVVAVNLFSGCAVSKKPGVGWSSDHEAVSKSGNNEPTAAPPRIPLPQEQTYRQRFAAPSPNTPSVEVPVLGHLFHSDSRPLPLAVAVPQEE